ncbi:MAG: 1-acyl-sn-glycerol-3-phosphate acyltransferase [Lachnoclostridium sp.]|nr:1-acyl-sn-glycerol-3-phosphate acyltransferase [Lachnoclostridium sp.]
MLHKILHPFLLRLIKLYCSYNIHIVNGIPILNTNVIYAVNHSCRYDMPIVGQAIEKHTYVLAGKQNLELLDRIFFRLNGVIYVDRKDKESKIAARNTMLKLLLKGCNLCVFPEGTWNLTPSKPMLPLYWGIIDIAKAAKTSIIPMILEYKGNDCYVKFGSPIYITQTDNKQDKINELTDIMATMRWDIWSMFPVVSRDMIDEGEWDREIQKRIKEYPKFDYEYEKSIIRKPYTKS